MCVGTDGLVSRGTLLEPDSLGPCEPGTTVNLEGIVWQETQGGQCHSGGVSCLPVVPRLHDVISAVGRVWFR